MGIGNGIGISWGKVSMAGGPVVNEAFEFTVKTDNAGTSAADQFTIPTNGTGYNYDISTSDGQSISGATGNTTITFPSPGSYTVSITGDFPTINFNNTGDKLKLTNISNWWSIAWSTFNDAFYGCSNLTITATDLPNVSAVTDFFFAFHTCTSLSGSFDCSSWDLSSVNNIGYMFYRCQQLTDINLSSLNPAVSVYSDGVVADCSNLINITFPVAFKPTSVRYLAQFTPNLSTITNVEAWNTSAMTLCTFMFNGSSFNQNIGSWDTSNVTDTQYMFRSATSFNQNIGSWNTSAVTNMRGMFQEATSFAGTGSSGGVSSWDTTNVSDMSLMFYDATSFNADISSWNISSLQNADGMLAVTSGTSSFSQVNYDALLQGWAAQPIVQSNVSLDVTQHFTLSSPASASRAVLQNTYNWAITDLGGI